MKALVTYYSESGNTKKVANALFEGLNAKQKAIKEIEDVSSFEEYDLIFCGFPVIEHSVPVKMRSFLRAIPSDSNVAFFATHGAMKDGVKSTTAFEAAGTMVPDSKVLGTFSVRGQVKSSVIEALEKKMEHKSWIDESISAIGHPNESDLKEAADFGNNMLKKAKFQTG